VNYCLLRFVVDYDCCLPLPGTGVLPDVLHDSRLAAHVGGAIYSVIDVTFGVLLFM
jgi:hypothetical protein